ncbi:MAG TPA: hypothetical protein VN372_00680 [Methanospirillum sp.]|nr:hypothetical protein [Methanospirillum sp.]
MEIRKLYEHILKFNEPVFLTVDNTGVGRPVLDLIREIGISPIGITITGGTEIRQDGDSLYVPKVEMITCLTVEFQTGKLKIIGTLPDSETIMKELAGFKRKQNIRTGHESFESWRDGIHDDLVLSVALPVWFCSWLMGQYCSIETFYYDDSAERRISSY